LEIPSIEGQEVLIFFLDGLCRWAKIELKRRGVQDLASAITATATLIEFKARVL